MKEIVMAREGWFRLSDEHLAWLKEHGISDADTSTFENDRSNPLLLECVKAVDIPAAEIVETARALKGDAEKFYGVRSKVHELCGEIPKFLSLVTSDAEKAFDLADTEDAIRAILDGTFDVLVEKSKHNRIKTVRFHRYLRYIVQSCVDMDVSSDDFAKVVKTICNPCKWDTETSATVVKWYETFFAYWKANKDAFFLGAEAQSAYMDFLEENALIEHKGGYSLAKGLCIEQYDDTLFDVHVERKYDDSYCGMGDYEVLLRTPYITKETVRTFVANNDADGLLNHLEALQSNICIKGA